MGGRLQAPALHRPGGFAAWAMDKAHVPFKKRPVQQPVPPSPEALYPVLVHGPGAPKELWSRQADVLRA
jgi:hypothetical protein